ncbi:MAG: hypothetical protein ACK4MW_02675 [Aquificaceae bacterium]
MISGYLSSKQDFVDLLNGCLFNKRGLLSLFLDTNVVSLYVDKSLVKGFKVPIEDDVEKLNKRSLLLYQLSEFMNNPEAFFTFREGNEKGIIMLEEPISAEELVLQLQLISQELNKLIDKVITPYAVVKVVKNSPEDSLYRGKSIYKILISSEKSLLDEIRHLDSLFSQGILDIDKFQSLEVYEGDAEIDCSIRSVEVEKVNLGALLKGLKLSKFTGLVNIKGESFNFEIYYRSGKVTALYPYDMHIFELLVSAKRCILNIIKIPESLLDLLVLKHAEHRAINSLPVDFLEVGKLLMSMNIEGKSGAIIVNALDIKEYVLYKNGNLVGILQERVDDIRVVRKLSLDKPSWIDVVFYQPMDNIRELAQLFLINILHGLILKYAGHLSVRILSRISSSEVFKHENGVILYRKMPKEEKEVSDLLSFLLDLSYKLLGKERFEKELETILSPYREVLKILQIEDYIKYLEA